LICTALLVISAACATAPDAVDTPLLDQLIGARLASLTSSPGATAYAHKADAALRQGRHTEAMVMLHKAVDMLRDDAPACSTRGPFLYLEGLAASIASDGSGDHGWDELRESCLNVDVPETERAAQAFFHYLTTDEDAGENSVAGLLEQFEDSAHLLPSKSKRTLELMEAGKRLGGSRGEMLQALAAWRSAVAEKKDGPCDTEFEERHRQSLAQAYHRMDAAGRADLATAYWGYAAVLGDGALDTAVLDALESWIREPKNEWLRTGVLASTLSTIRLSADWGDPLVTIPLCNELYDDLKEMVHCDGFDEFGYRNAFRLVDGFHAAGACLNDVAISGLTDAILEKALDSEVGRAGVLQFLGGMVTIMFMEIVDGSSTLHVFVLGELSRGTERIRSRLADSAEDRALDAVLAIVEAASVVLQGDLRYPLLPMEQAVITFDELAAKPADTDSPDMVRLAPGLRAGTLSLMAILQYLTDSADDAKQTLERLDRNLESDLASLLEYLEQPDHSKTLAGTMRAFGEMAAAQGEGAPALEAVAEKLVAISTAGENEEGWWGVGLDLLRTAAWDVLAMFANSEGARLLLERALVRAEALSGRAVERFLLAVDVPPTIKTPLRMIPPLHRAIPDMLAEESEGKDIAISVARVLEQPLNDVLAKVESPPDEETDGAATVTDLVLDLLKTAADVGLTSFMEEPKKALSLLAGQVEKRLDRYPPDIRVFVGTLVAAARFPYDQDKAHEAFEAAGAAAAEHLPALTFVPGLVEASLLLGEENSDPAQVLKLVDQALATGQDALECGKPHPVHSLLPFRMWALTVLGKRGQAGQTYELYRTLVQNGFAGDASIDCVLRSFSEDFIFNIHLGNSVCGFALPGKQEGTFQVGAGSQFGVDIPRRGDDLSCDVAEPTGPRLDRIMEAHMAWAVYSMLSSDDRVAHMALLDAIAAGRMLVHGSSAILGVRGASMLGESAKLLDLSMIAWTSLLARLRGHSQVADILEQLGQAVASSREGGWQSCLPEDDSPPVFLERFARLEAFGPLVRGWIEAKTHKDATDLQEQLTGWGEKTGFAADWGVALAADSLVAVVDGQTGKQLRVPKLKVPEDKVGMAATMLRNTLVAAGTAQSLPSTISFEKVADALTLAGLYGEIAGPASRLALFARWGGDHKTALALLDVALQRLPADKAPVMRADVLALGSELLIEVKQHSDALTALMQVIPVLSGREPAQSEITRRWTRLRYQGGAGHVEPLKLHLKTLLPMLNRAYGSRNSSYYTLLAVKLALALQMKDVDPQVVETLVTHGPLVEDVDDTVDFLKLLADSPDYEDKKRLANEYLKFVLQGGPAPKPVSPPPV